MKTKLPAKSARQRGVRVEFTPAQLALFTAASKKTGASVSELVQTTALFALTFNLDDDHGYFLGSHLWRYSVRGEIPDIDGDWGYYGFPFDKTSPQNRFSHPAPAAQTEEAK